MSDSLKENLESILLDFEHKAQSKLSGSDEAIQKQLYFIRLVVAACVCKFNMIPDLDSLKKNPDIVDALGFSSAIAMHKALSAEGKRVTVSSARKAAKVLGIKLSPNRFIKYRKDPKSANFKWYQRDPKSTSLCLLHDLPIDTDSVVEAFIKEAKRKAGEITPRLENQIYFRKLLIEAYVFKFNSAPRKFSQARRAEAFGFKSSHTLYHYLTNLKETLKPKTAKTALEILNKEFQPPHSDELKTIKLANLKAA